jgi:hypothetical protein
MPVALPLGVAILVVVPAPARGRVVGLVLVPLLAPRLRRGVAVPPRCGDGLRHAAENRAEQRGHHGASPAGPTEEAGELIEAGGIHSASPGGCGAAPSAGADPRPDPEGCQSSSSGLDTEPAHCQWISALIRRGHEHYRTRTGVLDILPRAP